MAKQLFVYAEDTQDSMVHKTNGRHSNLLLTKEDMGADGFIVGCHSMEPGGGAEEHCHEGLAVLDRSQRIAATLRAPQWARLDDRHEEFMGSLI